MRELKPGIGGEIDTTPAFNFHMFSSFLPSLRVLCVLCGERFIGVSRPKAETKGKIWE
jgi:hypothetical protein